MKRILLILAGVLFLPGLALGQIKSATPHRSANNCPEPPDPDHFHWRVRGLRPVDRPIQGVIDVPRVAKNPIWYMIALRDWPITMEDIKKIMEDADAGNFVRVAIPPCTVLDDMIFGVPPSNYNAPVIYDPDDKQDAYAYQIQVKDTVRVWFFEHCANPAYQSVVVTEVVSPPPPPPPSQEVRLQPPTKQQVPPLAPPPKPVLPQQVPPPAPTVLSCPDVRIEPYASWKSRLLGPFLPHNLWETGVSVGGGAGGAYVFSTKSVRNTQAWKSGAASLGAKIGIEFLNPDKDMVRISVAGLDEIRIKKGEDKAIIKEMNGIPMEVGRVMWKGSQARVFLLIGKTEHLCGTGNTINNINLTPVPIIKRIEIRTVIREVPVPVEPVKPPGQLTPRP